MRTKKINVFAEVWTKIIDKAEGGNHFGSEKAKEILLAAKNTFGIDDTYDTYSTLIKKYLNQIKFIQKDIAEIEKKISDIMQEIGSTITTIPGVSTILGAIILSEIGDVSRFSSPNKLAAFAGIDPSIKQSGDYSSIRNHMSKRGSPYLRRALWMACTTSIQFDPMFKEYYLKKRSEGKSYMTTLGHISKKLITVIFAILRDNKKYEPVITAA